MAKQVTKQRVKLREDKTADNRLTLYLDWSKDNKRQREYIKLFVFENPKSVFEKHHNKETYEKAEILRAERESQFFNGILDDAIKYKKVRNSDFYEFFENYIQSYKKKDLRMMKAVFSSFKTFAPPPLSTKEVDETLIEKFKEYLEMNYHGETPQSYFARFKKFMAYSSKGKDRIFRENPAKEIKNTKNEGSKSIPKDILTIDELKTLVNTNCGNETVKNAFLFACNTGLGFTDIQEITWDNIKVNNGEYSLTFKRTKTNVEVKMILNENALLYLPKVIEKKGKIFTLPSNNGTNSNLKNWAKRAGIDKKITFYCSRHSFGTLLAYYNTDVLTISNLLGHTSLKHTVKYVRVADEIKKQAVNSIPNF
jgi:integrase/recombinase XerD